MSEKPDIIHGSRRIFSLSGKKHTEKLFLPRLSPEYEEHDAERNQSARDHEMQRGIDNFFGHPDNFIPE